MNECLAILLNNTKFNFFVKHSDQLLCYFKGKKVLPCISSLVSIPSVRTSVPLLPCVIQDLDRKSSFSLTETRLKKNTTNLADSQANHRDIPSKAKSVVDTEKKLFTFYDKARKPILLSPTVHPSANLKDNGHPANSSLKTAKIGILQFGQHDPCFLK